MRNGISGADYIEEEPLNGYRIRSISSWRISASAIKLLDQPRSRVSPRLSQKCLAIEDLSGSEHLHALERQFEAYLVQISEMLPMSGPLAPGEGPGGGLPLPVEEFWDNLST